MAEKTGNVAPEGHTILLVDDHRDSLDLLVIIFRRYLPEAKLATAEDGREALARAREVRPDLVLLDVELPDMDGFEVCARLKKSSATRSSPVLMVSGALVDSADRSRGLESGADGYLCKPFEHLELMAQVRALLRVKDYGDQLVEQRGRLERALVERTRQLRMIYDHSPDAIFVETDDGEILEANRAACELHGLERDELVGKNFLDLVPPEQHEEARRRHDRLVQGESKQLFDAESLGPDGRRIPVEIWASDIDYEGQRAHLLHVRDVTARRGAEEGLREVESRFSSIFNHSNDAIIIHGLDGNIIHVNEKALEQFGYTRTDMEAMNVVALSPPMPDGEMETRLRATAESGEYRFETEFQRADGSVFPGEVAASLFEMDGVPVIQGLVRDITEQCETEKQREAERGVLEMIAAGRPRDEILERLTLMVEDLTPGARCSVLLVDPTGKHLCDIAAPHLSDAYRKAVDGLPVGPAVACCGTAAYTGQTVVVEDIETDPLWAPYRDLARAEGLRACWSVPIVHRDGRILGTFAMYHPECRRPSDSDIKRVELAVHLARIAVERAQASEEQVAVADGLRGVVEAADELMGCQEPETLYRRAVELAREKLGLERCAIFVEEGETIRGTFGTDMDGATTDERTHVQPKAGSWVETLQPTEPERASSQVKDGPRHEWRDGAVRTLAPGWQATTPIARSGEQPRAAFTNDAAITEAPFDSRKQALVAVYASLLSSLLERLQAEAQLREAEQKYRSLVEQLPAVTYVTSFEGGSHTTYISPQVETLLGFTPGEWERDRELWMRQVHPDDRTRVLEQVQKADRQSETLSLEYRVLSKDGLLHWFRNHGTYVRGEDGKPLQLHGVMLDITGRKQAEERERELQHKLARSKRMESLGLLAGGVAHDLNNILGPLVAYPDLILAELPQDQTSLREDVMEIGKSAKRATEVIQDLLSLARRGNYQVEPVDLNHVVREHLTAMDFQIIRGQYPDIVVQTNLDAKPVVVKGSAPHLDRVVGNLLNNAFEAMANGGTATIVTSTRSVREHARAMETIAAGDYVVLSISDTGQGIPEEDIERIFEPFYTKRKLGRNGTGLGLAVVYGILRDLGGFVDVQSKEGEGSTFEVYLPATEALPEVHQDPDLIQGGTESLLVVDDVKEQRELATRLLGKLGYTVHAVSSGHEALDFLARQEVDLLILDMIMEEGFDGLDTFEAVLKIRPDQRCLLASGFAETDRVRKAQRLGAGAYIRKPYTLRKISRAVRRELDGVPH